MLAKDLLQVANLVARGLKAAAPPGATPASRARTTGLPAEEMKLRQQYQRAGEAAVDLLQSRAEIAVKYRQEDERSRARAAKDSTSLSRAELANGNAFYFSRRARGHEYTREQAALMEARIKRNIAVANLQSEFTVPVRFTDFPL
ncbi:unnamed protein product [marine sediment metagenome]|uniref:Uncharacterized protein n=1 Tax=marine sediment metagenome TaxID=412755 RepID=X1KU90_9ZZZZ